MSNEEQTRERARQLIQPAVDEIDDLRALVTRLEEENKNLRGQVTTLQAKGSALVLENRALRNLSTRTELSGQTEAFMHTCDQNVRRVPEIPSGPDGEAEVRLRGLLVLEEACEFAEAIVPEGPARAKITRAKTDILDLLSHTEIKVDLPAAVDALTDIDYVVDGTRHTFGVNGLPIARAVHDKNMEKANGPISPTGKRLKPPGWTPADVRALLIEQGWREAA